jgi:hypothetical protein
MFDKSFGGCVSEFEAESDIDWLHTDGFRVPFDYALTLINERRDVFLGYSSASETTAVAIKRYLLSLAAKVLDWQTDFFPAVRYSITRSDRTGGDSLGWRHLSFHQG